MINRLLVVSPNKDNITKELNILKEISYKVIKKKSGVYRITAVIV